MSLDRESEGEDQHANDSERAKEVYRDPMAANREADCHADQDSPTSSNQDNKVETCDEDIDDGGVLCI